MKKLKGKHEICRHCGKTIDGCSETWFIHASGQYRFKSRCNPEDTGLPYGLNAHPVTVSCESNGVCAGKEEAE